MSLRRQVRRAVALTVAYIVALQTLLGGLTVSAMPSGGDAVAPIICRTGTPVPAERKSPIHHTPICPCAPACGMTTCGAHMACGTRRHLPVAALPQRQQSAVHPARDAAVALPDLAEQPQGPRGPPTFG